MNTQIELQSRANQPLAGHECVKFLAVPRAMGLSVPEMPPPAEPSEDAAYGCVEWFNYERHPLRGRLRREKR